MSSDTLISSNAFVVTPSTVKTLIPPFLLLTGGIISIILFILTIVYYVVSKDCDIIFWVLLTLSILIGILSSIGSVVNNFVIMTKFLPSINKQCNMSPLGIELMNEPLSSPWIAGIMSLLSFLVFVAAITYFLIIKECNGIFWGLIIIGFFLNNMASFRDYVNTKLALRIADVELKTCKASFKNYIDTDSTAKITPPPINLSSQENYKAVKTELKTPCANAVANKDPDYSLTSKLVNMN